MLVGVDKSAAIQIRDKSAAFAASSTGNSMANTYTGNHDGDNIDNHVGGNTPIS